MAPPGPSRRAREIYEILTSLEPTAVELLARRRPPAAEIAPLLQACHDMETALAGPAADLKAWPRPTSSAT
ncbi:FCD domain-containing protein [Alsobacter soli]|uniref:FCD domain-containing protein n=1 Tax=Alsobacter soli TaxID=2109933 RepID=UPI003CCA41D3